MRLLKYNGLDVNPGRISESTLVRPKILPESSQAFKEAKTESGRRFLLPRIEAIHAGATRNHTRYPADKLRGHAELKSGVYSWTQPYPKPVIFNHDVETRATGRIMSAHFAEMTAAGRPGIVVVPKITDAEAVDGILEGRLLTVSIGATTDAAICSICGTDIIEEGFCGHWKGEVYDGVKAEWIAGNLWFDELSWVNVPADQDAMIVDAGEVSVAEAFAQSGKELMNLGKKSTEWTVDQKLAVAEGLIESGGEKGESVVTVEELQAQVDELNKKLEDAASQVGELTSQVETLTSEKESLTQELEGVKTSLDEANTTIESQQADLEAKTTEATEATSAKEAAEAKVEELTQEKEALEQEKTGLLEKNAELATEMHKSVAERVVDLKVSLGKVVEREAAVEQHLGRSTESLQDTLVDLLAEAASTPVQRTAEQLTNPAKGTVSGKEKNEVTEGDKQPEQKQLTAEDALKGLFSGPAFRRR